MTPKDRKTHPWCRQCWSREKQVPSRAVKLIEIAWRCLHAVVFKEANNHPGRSVFTGTSPPLRFIVIGAQGIAQRLQSKIPILVCISLVDDMLPELLARNDRRRPTAALSPMNGLMMHAALIEVSDPAVLGLNINSRVCPALVNMAPSSDLQLSLITTLPLNRFTV